MAVEYFPSSFGGLPLMIIEITTDDGRDIVRQSPSRGSRHFLSDRGGKFGKADCDLLFCNEPGKRSYLDRFLEFRDLVAKPEPQIFSHPFIGSYSARAEGGQHSANAQERSIRYRCAFLPDDEPQPTTPSGAGAAPIAGVESVSAAAAAANQALAAAGLASSAPDDALDTIRDLADSMDRDLQGVITRTATVTAGISEGIATLQLATSVERWPAYRAMVQLLASVQLARETLRSNTRQMFSHRVEFARPLLAICAELYGAEQASVQADRVARMNRVRTPNRVPAGTTLVMPSRST